MEELECWISEFSIYSCIIFYGHKLTTRHTLNFKEAKYLTWRTKKIFACTLQLSEKVKSKNIFSLPLHIMTKEHLWWGRTQTTTMPVVVVDKSASVVMASYDQTDITEPGFMGRVSYKFITTQGVLWRHSSSTCLESCTDLYLIHHVLFNLWIRCNLHHSRIS